MKHFGKEYLSIYWEDIVEINAYIYNLSAKYLSLVTKNARIDFHPSKKMYDTIMKVCPYESFKTRINNFEEFKWFHRNKKTGD